MGFVQASDWNRQPQRVVMMVSHDIHLMEHEGEAFGEEMIIRGSLDVEYSIAADTRNSW